MKRIWGYRPSPATAIALTALAVALGGVAYATIPDSNGTIHACYQRNGGNLRVVDENNGCRQSEKPLAWQQGQGLGTTLWAVASNDGTLLRGRGAISVSTNPPNSDNWQVVFGRDISSCAYSGTEFGANESGAVGLNLVPGHPDTLHALSLTSGDGLSLVVFC